MSQFYPEAHLVVPAYTMTGWYNRGTRNRNLQTLLIRDGQIVPLLVRETPHDDPDYATQRYYVTDSMQAERLGALHKLEFGTILVETEWTEEDL